MKFHKIHSVRGEVKAPPSKSLKIRALVGGILSGFPVEIENFIPCRDSEAALGAAEALGKEVRIMGSRLIMDGRPKVSGETLINCGESALTARLLAPVVSLWPEPVRLTGEKSLLTRPFDMVEQPLRLMGVNISSSEGKLPLFIQGPMVPGEIMVDGRITSQFLSGLLMALPVLNGDSRVIVGELRSRSYIDLTLEILDAFGIRIDNRNYSEFMIPGGQRYSGGAIRIEGDWSGAAFFLVAGALKGGITISGLRRDSLQGDRMILEALKKAGARVNIGRDTLTVSKGDLRAFDFDASDCPDLFPPLAVLAAGCRGVTVIKGTRRLKHKESDRGQAIISEFGKLGIDIRIEKDHMLISGGKVSGGPVSAHGDHRMAMALISASVIASGPIEIDDIACIEKSYPRFLEDFRAVTGDD